MTVIHKKCGTKLISAGKGDYGYCTTCKCDVHHLIIGKDGMPDFSKEVEIKW